MLDMNIPMKHILGMKLETYLNKYGMTDEAFASLIGHSQPQVNRLRRGVSFPSRKMVAAIHNATSGAVTASDWHDLPPSKAKGKRPMKEAAE